MGVFDSVWNIYVNFSTLKLILILGMSVQSSSHQKAYRT
jgi:hypothetical protein